MEPFVYLSVRYGSHAESAFLYTLLNIHLYDITPKSTYILKNKYDCFRNLTNLFFFCVLVE